jgi:hypothetical protein
MAFTLKPTRSIRRELTRVVRRQLQRAEQHVREATPAAVYEARKNLKKARAVVALLDEAGIASLRKDADRLRQAGHMLAVLRDADAVVTTFDHVRSHARRRLPEHTFAILRRRLMQAKARAVTSTKFGLSRVARTLSAVGAHAKHWDVPSIGKRKAAKLLEPGYRACRKAMRRAYDEMLPTDLHRWRRRVKTHWYHRRLLEQLAPSLRGEIKDLRKLETLLGEDHNLTLLQEAIAKDEDVTKRVPAAVTEISAMCAADQARLRKKAFALGRRLFRHKPKVFSRRVRRALAGKTRSRTRTARRRPAA